MSSTAGADYREVVESLPVPAYTTDGEGWLQLFNRAAVELWGREPVVGQDRWCGAAKMERPDGGDLPPDK